MSDLRERVAREHYNCEIRQPHERSWESLRPGVQEAFRQTADPYIAIVLEEAAYVEPGFFYETVAPLLLIGNTSLLAISTLTSEINFYTRLLRMRDKVTGLPLFTSISVQLACRKCIEDGRAAACIHMLHLVPRWQSSDRHVKLKTIMQVRLSNTFPDLDEKVTCTSAGPAGPHRERAVRPGLRLEPADLQDRPHRDHVQPAPAPAHPQRGGLHVHRPGCRRASERLRRPERDPPQGPAHGESSSY